jgi:hypothetical protein
MTTHPTITQFKHSSNITYIYPSTFILISHNLIPTTHNPSMSITISPTGDTSSPYSSSSHLELSKPSSLLYNTEYTTLTTEHHTPSYLSPIPLTIYNSNYDIIPPSQYHNITNHSNISIQINETLLHHSQTTQFHLTSIYLH